MQLSYIYLTVSFHLYPPLSLHSRIFKNYILFLFNKLILKKFSKNYAGEYR